MQRSEVEKIMKWVLQELKMIEHGELHVILKVRDSRVALIEKVKIVKEKPSE